MIYQIRGDNINTSIEADSDRDAIVRYCLSVGRERESFDRFNCVPGQDGQRFLIVHEKQVVHQSDEDHLADAWIASVEIIVPSVSLDQLGEDYEVYDPDEALADCGVFSFADFVSCRYGNIEAILAEAERRFGSGYDLREILIERFIPEVIRVLGVEMVALGIEEPTDMWTYTYKDPMADALERFKA